MKLLACLAVMLAVAIAIAPGPAAADGPLKFFVAPGGDDAGPGTEAKPFATIARARDAVRAARNGDTSRHARVAIATGTYDQAETLTFGPEDSNSLYWPATGGVVVSGGRRITGFAAGPDGLWRVKIPDVAAGKWQFNELFVNGRRATRARSPNDGYFRVVKAGPDNRSSFTFKPGDLAALKDPADAEIVLLHDWSISRVRIASVDAKANVVRLADPVGPGRLSFFTISHWGPHPRYFVENARELLDAPGEWFLDRASGELIYRPRERDHLATAEVVAPVLDCLVRVAGDAKSGRPVEHLVLMGLWFSHCAFARPAHGYAGMQACFHDRRDKDGKSLGAARMPAAIAISNARNCRLDSCTVQHVGGTGVSLRAGCTANTLQNCGIRDIAGNGIMIGEAGAAAADMARDNRVNLCSVSRCGQVYFGAVGVWAGLTDGTVVSRCRIRDLPYTGVSVGWSWNVNPTPCANNRVENNDIHDVMLTLSDGGGIYTLGRQPGTVIRGNLIHDVPANAGRAESNGMFLDEGSSQMVVEGNTIYATARSPIRFHKATTETVRRNVLACAAGVPPFRYNACDPKTMTIEDNRIVKAEDFHPPPPDTRPD